MERTIKLSGTTEKMFSLILDLEKLSSDFYTLVREELCPDDSPENTTGDDISQKTSELREVFDYYLRDRINFNLTQMKNLESVEAVL